MPNHTDNNKEHRVQHICIVDTGTTFFSIYAVNKILPYILHTEQHRSTKKNDYKCVHK